MKIVETVFGCAATRLRKADERVLIAKFRKWVSILLCFISLCLPVLANEIAVSSKQSVKVIDGDTIKIINLYDKTLKVRLSGIDAPELNQKYGEESANYLRHLLKGGDFVIWSTGRDRYGRLLGIIKVNNVDINLLMIKSGYAWAYRRYLSSLPQKKGPQYLTAELNARDLKLGIWVQRHPTSPWQFRRSKKSRQ